MSIIKKWGPIGAIGFGGAALSGMLTKSQGTAIKLAVGVVLTGATLYGASQAGLLKL